MVTEKNREYELVVIVTHEADEDETAETLEMFTKFISDQDGSVSSREDWGIRRLAYPIKNYQEGNYVLLRFDLNPTDINELDRMIGSSQSIIRHLVTVVNDPISQEPEQIPSTDQQEDSAEAPDTEQIPSTDQQEDSAEAPDTEQIPSTDQQEDSAEAPDTEQKTPPETEDNPKD